MPAHPVPRMLNYDEVCAYCGGVDRATVYKWVKWHNFPLPVKLRNNSTGWYSHEVESWLLNPDTLKGANKRLKEIIETHLNSVGKGGDKKTASG